MDSAKGTEDDRGISWLALIVAAGIALRVVAIVGFNHVPESDELAYKSMALNLVSGVGIVDYMGNHAMYNVGYPLFVLAPVFFLFGESLLVVKGVHVVLGGIAISLCYFLAKEAGAGRVGRLVAAALWALYLPSSIYAVYLAKENLMIPLVLGVIWCALRLMKESSSKVALGCGVLLGLLALTGNAALSLVGVVMLALVFTPASVWQRLVFAILVLIASLSVSAPWLVRNMEAIGAPVLNTNGGFNLYLGNNPAATGWFVSITDTPRGATWKELASTGEVAASETLKKEAISWIKEHPTEFLALSLRKAKYFWTPPLHDGKGQTSTSETIVRLMWLLQFVVLMVFAVSSLLLAGLRNRQLSILWLAVAGYTAVHMLFYVSFRYRLTIMPVLGILAALAIESLLVTLSKARKGVKS